MPKLRDSIKELEAKYSDSENEIERLEKSIRDQKSDWAKDLSAGAVLAISVCLVSALYLSGLVPGVNTSKEVVNVEPNPISLEGLDNCLARDVVPPENCDGRSLSIYARYEGTESDVHAVAVLGLDDATGKLNISKLENASDLLIGDLVRVQGTLLVDRSNNTSYMASASIVHNPTNENRMIDDLRNERISNNRGVDDRVVADLIEQDSVLLEVARDKRSRMISEAEEHIESSSSGLVIDSFRFQGDRFVVCNLTWPGPIYSCDND